MFYTAMASILKNYTQHEQMTANLSYSLKNMDMLRRIAKFQPQGMEVSQDTTSYLDALQVDFSEGGMPTLYDVPSCSITELRDDGEDCTFNREEMNNLLLVTACDADENTLVMILFDDYSEFILANHKSPLNGQFLTYMEQQFQGERRVEFYTFLQTMILHDREEHKRPALLTDWQELDDLLPLRDGDAEFMYM